MIDKLEMFIALANERHFGRAAEACRVTQPSLSGAIRQLEDQLGVQLVYRGSRFQGLTPEGQRVLEMHGKYLADHAGVKIKVEKASVVSVTKKTDDPEVVATEVVSS